jgi:hypothetical protein
MLAPIHLRIMLPCLQHCSRAGWKLSEIFPVAGHVETPNLMHFVVAVKLGVGVDEIVVHIKCA